VLVAQLTRISKPDDPDRATLAHLRRSLGETEDRVLGKAGWLFSRVPELKLSDAILGAGLFALAKGDCPQHDTRDFGRAFGSLAGKGDNPSVEKRFIDLLDTDKADLPHKLRQAVTLIARESIGLDWKMLFAHLDGWGHPDRWVQKKWARGFWANYAEEETAADTPAAAAT